MEHTHKALTYPARLVVSRPPTRVSPEPYVTVDRTELHDAEELAHLLTVYRAWERGYRTVGVYTYTAVPAGEAEATAARILAELTSKNGAGSAANTPAPAAPEGTTKQQEDSTKPAERQVELVVCYETDQARWLPRTGAAELVALKVDGKPAGPPTTDLNQLYRLLRERGYKPTGFMWMGPALLGKRQRRQIYTRSGRGG